MTKSEYVEISVIVPCYNCEKSIEELNDRLINTINDLAVTYEIIYINDCSKDDSLNVLKQIAKNNTGVMVIDLMFNVGQFRALMCGFEHSCGEYVITMDDDLQHPPEEIGKLYHHLKCNPEIDVVIGKYIKKEHSFIRNLGSNFFSKISEKIMNKPKDINLSAFRCLNRKLVNTLIAHKTIFPVMGPLIIKSTDKIANVSVSHDTRKYGQSNYSFIKLVRTTLDHILNVSSLPLRVTSLFGVSAAFLSFIVAFFYFLKYLIYSISVPGWTSIILMINFYSGLLLLAVGVIGEYLIRILFEVKGYPRYRKRNIYRHEKSSSE